MIDSSPKGPAPAGDNRDGDIPESDSDVRHLLALYELTDQDLERIRAYGERHAAGMGDVVARFYEWLEHHPDFSLFFSSAETLIRVKNLQLAYWREFVSGRVDEAYVARRRRVGETHARIGLSVDTYLAAMNRFLQLLLEPLAGEQEAPAQIQTAAALTKLMSIDLSIVIGAFNTRTQAIVFEQTESLLQMSTPVTRLWDDVLLLPIVGLIDSKRANQIMNAMLAAIADTQARASILDIRGVAVVDTAVANHLIKITKATKLMGCECIISGISPAIAQTMVELGIEVGDVKTTATLGAALRYAFNLAGLRIVEANALDAPEDHSLAVRNG